MVLDLCHGYKEYSFSMCFSQLVTQMCRSMDTWIGFLEVVMKQTDYQSTLSVFMVSGWVISVCCTHTVQEIRLSCISDLLVAHMLGLSKSAYPQLTSRDAPVVPTPPTVCKTTLGVLSVCIL